MIPNMTELCGGVMFGGCTGLVLRMLGVSKSEATCTEVGR
jgi:hypothetical protein